MACRGQQRSDRSVHMWQLRPGQAPCSVSGLCDEQQLSQSISNASSKVPKASLPTALSESLQSLQRLLPCVCLLAACSFYRSRSNPASQAFAIGTCRRLQILQRSLPAVEASQAKQAERLMQDAPRRWNFRAEDPCASLGTQHSADKAGAAAAAQAARQAVTAHAGREPVAAASQTEAAPAAAPAAAPPAVTLAPQVRAIAAEHMLLSMEPSV